MGIRGVAIAWLLRVVIDAILLFLFSWRLLPENNFMVKKLPLLVTGALAIFSTAIFLNGAATKIIFVVAACLLVTVALWQWMLSAREKTALLSGLRGGHVHNS
jgi:hypothetical protein